MFLDDCEILFDTKLIKLNNFLMIINSVNYNIQLRMELSDNKFPFFDGLAAKTSKKFWMNIAQNQLILNPVFSNHPKPWLKNTTFC